jgi:ribosomal protein S18 acetylase RimI-like enzyme
MTLQATARRIEAAEAASLHAINEACTGANKFALPAGAGFALFSALDSPLNKVVGVGFEPVQSIDLDAIERAYAVHGSAVQVELSTYADAALTNVLARRGYELSGYEHVLSSTLDATRPTDSDVDVRRAYPDELDAWVDVMVNGFSEPDGSAPTASHDDFERTTLERVFREFAGGDVLERWLAFRGGEIAGAASMRLQDGIAQLFGAATLPRQRRHGVQSALLSARLRSARERGCDLAVITTQPGSKSQQNAERAGFRLLYARAVWVKAPS